MQLGWVFKLRYQNPISAFAHRKAQRTYGIEPPHHNKPAFDRLVTKITKTAPELQRIEKHKMPKERGVNPVQAQRKAEKAKAIKKGNLLLISATGRMSSCVA